MSKLKINTEWGARDKNNRLEIRCTGNLKTTVKFMADNILFGAGYKKTESEIVRIAIIEFARKHKIIKNEEEDYL